jgi:hypothetical protein
MTDEKLSECSAESTGVYIRLMCIMHKSEEYGTILLKQKDKQTSKQILNFATKLAKNMPYDILVIERSLNELIEENVISLDGDYLKQRRMIKDCVLSEMRSVSGKKGGEETSKKIKNAKAKNKARAKEFAKAKDEANSEYENENENENINEYGIENKGGLGEKTKIDISKISEAWAKWIKFKKDQFRFVYKSEESEELAKAELLKLSKNNSELALKIVERSMKNNWKGLFELPDESKPEFKNNPGLAADMATAGTEAQGIARAAAIKMKEDLKSQELVKN